MNLSAEEFTAIKQHASPMAAACAWAGVGDHIIKAMQDILGDFKSVRDLAGMPMDVFWAALKEQQAEFMVIGKNDAGEGEEKVVMRKLRPWS